jgi:hypothetical protein
MLLLTAARKGYRKSLLPNSLSSGSKKHQHDRAEDQSYGEASLVRIAYWNRGA